LKNHANASTSVNELGKCKSVRFATAPATAVALSSVRATSLLLIFQYLDSVAVVIRLLSVHCVVRFWSPTVLPLFSLAAYDCQHSYTSGIVLTNTSMYLTTRSCIGACCTYCYQLLTLTDAERGMLMRSV
jgi:hypothetical protein